VIKILTQKEDEEVSDCLNEQKFNTASQELMHQKFLDVLSRLFAIPVPNKYSQIEKK
jgi:hypothetical protein